MEKTRRIAILGSTRVGKSSLSFQFTESTFSETYSRTIENAFTKSVTFDGQKFVLEILDTAGQTELSVMPLRPAANIHGVLLVYSITSRRSFMHLTLIRDRLIDLLGSPHLVPMMLVGNKTDLDNGVRREVSPEEGKAKAREWGSTWRECSAKTGEGVNEVFKSLVWEMERAEMRAWPVEGGRGCAAALRGVKGGGLGQAEGGTVDSSGSSWWRWPGTRYPNSTRSGILSHSTTAAANTLNSTSSSSSFSPASPLLSASPSNSSLTWLGSAVGEWWRRRGVASPGPDANITTKTTTSPPAATSSSPPDPGSSERCVVM